MNLDDLLELLRRTLHEVDRKGRSNYEMRIDVSLIEQIEWHLSQYRTKVGNTGYPPGRGTASEEERYWGDYSRSKRGEAFNEDLWKTWEQYMRGASAGRSNRYDFEWGPSPFGSESHKSNRSHTPPPTPEEEPRAWTAILGVRSTATKPEITKAYRSLAMKYHPDRKGGSNEKMAELNSAYRKAMGK